jgi:formiminotetrahydrofolate cyclodeaminase
MTLGSQSLSDILAAIRSPAPTPGGGSASAIAGALGAALLSMVASMPKHRAASEEDVDRLEAAGRRAAAISDALLALADRDAEAYERVMAAYRLPKGSDQEKTERSGAIQQAMRGAIDTPLSTMTRCGEAIEAGTVVARFGNPNAASDVGVALELLAAGQRGARLNVEINLASVKDANFAGGIRGDVARLEEEAERGAAAARALIAADRRP